MNFYLNGYGFNAIESRSVNFGDHAALRSAYATALNRSALLVVDHPPCQIGVLNLYVPKNWFLQTYCETPLTACLRRFLHWGSLIDR